MHYLNGKFYSDDEVLSQADSIVKTVFHAKANGLEHEVTESEWNTLAMADKIVANREHLRVAAVKASQGPHAKHLSQ